MADTFELELVTPERQLIKEQVEEAQIPGKEGYLGVLPGHAPLLTELGTGFMYYVVGGKRRYLSIHGGFAEVLPDRVRPCESLPRQAVRALLLPASSVHELVPGTGSLPART